MRLAAREILRIAASMTGACAIGAAVLGAVYVATDRYQVSARTTAERDAVAEMLGLDAGAPVREVQQYLAPEQRRVVYRITGAAGEAGREVTFDLDGRLVSRRDLATEAGVEKGLRSLGRLFVAERGGRPVGFVVEGEGRGYKNVIRFFVAIDSSFDLAGVRVIEHEEDPGLGAEVATPWFQGQFIGRPASMLSALEVSRDPMPEDWRAALDRLDRTPLATWRAANQSLVARERAHPIYAVTGATISSRALTDGVRTTADHFRRRWALIAPFLGAAPGGPS